MAVRITRGEEASQLLSYRAAQQADGVVMTVLPTGKYRNLKISFAALGVGFWLFWYLSTPYDSIWKARETVLRQDLYVMRTAIDQYTLDKQKAPHSLQDLISAKYLKEVPEDPITRSCDTWEIVEEDSEARIDEQHPGIVDVHSGSHQVSRNGTVYSTW